MPRDKSHRSHSCPSRAGARHWWFLRTRRCRTATAQKRGSAISRVVGNRGCRAASSPSPAPAPVCSNRDFSATTVFCSPGAQRHVQKHGDHRALAALGGPYMEDDGLMQIIKIWAFKQPSVKSWLEELAQRQPAGQPPLDPRPPNSPFDSRAPQSLLNLRPPQKPLLIRDPPKSSP